MVGGGRVRLHRRDHRVRGHEPGDVVHVAVGVVPGDAPLQPDHPGDAQVLGERPLVVRPAPRPGLRCCTSPSRHSSVVSRAPRPFTSMDPPSSTSGRPSACRRDHLGAGGAGHAPADRGVPLEVRVLGPGGEAPAHGAQGRRRRARRCSPNPAPRCGRWARGGSATSGERRRPLARSPAAPGPRRRAPPTSAHRLGPGQVAHDLGVDPGDGAELPGPVLAVVGPGQPGGRVGLPLGGHAPARLHRPAPSPGTGG